MNRSLNHPLVWHFHQLLLNNFDSYGHLNLLDSCVSHEMEVPILYLLLCIPIHSTAAQTCCTSSLPSDKLLTVRTRWYSEANWTIPHDKLQFLLLLPEQTVQLWHCTCQTNKYYTTESVLQFMYIQTLYKLLAQQAFRSLKSVAQLPLLLFFFLFLVGWSIIKKEMSKQQQIGLALLVATPSQKKLQYT